MLTSLELVSGFPFLGMTPNGLTWTPNCRAISCEPTSAILPNFSSWSRYADTTSWCAFADIRFFFALCSRIPLLLKPILKPFCNPPKIKPAKFLSSWLRRCSSQKLHFTGDVIDNKGPSGRSGLPGLSLQSSNVKSLLV